MESRCAVKPRIPVHFRNRTLAGSPLNTTKAEKPPQEPHVSLAQVEREADLIATLAADRKPRKISAREEFALGRREIAALLDDPRIASALDENERRQYRQLAHGNLSEKQLGREIAADIPPPETALQQTEEDNWTRAYIEELENRIIARAEFCGKRFAAHKRVETDGNDRTKGEDAAAQDREVAQSGGKSIGGSIIGGEHRYGKKPGTTFRPPKEITSFEKSGNIHRQSGGSPDHDEPDGEAEHDDYGEDSSG